MIKFKLNITCFLLTLHCNYGVTGRYWKGFVVRKPNCPVQNRSAPSIVLDEIVLHLPLSPFASSTYDRI